LGNDLSVRLLAGKLRELFDESLKLFMQFLRSIEFKLVIAWIVVIGITILLDPNSTYRHETSSSAEMVLRQTVLLGFFAVGSAVIVISGGIDLSCGSVIALSGTVFGSLLMLLDPSGFKEQHISGGAVAGALIGTLIVGMVVGTFHAWLITRVGLPPFVATLATLVGLRSLSRVMMTRVTSWFYEGTTRSQIEFPDPDLRATIKYLPYYAILFIVLTIGLWFLMTRTVIGRRLHAMGGNENAARLSGIRTDQLKWLAYVIGALTASLAGIIYFADTSSAKPDIAGRGYELNAIAAAVIGGCSLRGGVGTITGTVLGCLFLRTVIDAVTKIVGTSADLYEGIIVGVVVVLAVAFSQRGSSSEKKLMFDGPLGITMVPMLAILSGLLSMMLMPPTWNVSWAGAFAVIVFIILLTRAIWERKQIA
jgi:ribose/xylose/arabinose/galactoside ABC-type transport system permease subunit